MAASRPQGKRVFVGSKAFPEKPLSSVDYVDLGFVSASVTWRMKIPSSGCSVSSISYIYDDAIASVVPSLLKAREVMLVGYRWNWHRCFLLNGSQILTNPSEPPAKDANS